MRKFVAAAAFAAMALAPAGALAQGGLTGTWSGVVVQTFTDGRTAAFSTIIAFRPDGTAESAYPSDACGGILTPLAQKGSPTYREEITYGGDVCVGGTIMLTLVGDTLHYHWESPGNGTAEGTLRPTEKGIPPVPAP